MTYKLNNGKVEIEVIKKGAELRSFKDVETGQEYLWQAGKEWAKTAPILFPFVGGFKDDKFLYDGKEFAGLRHGIAREMDHEIVVESDDELTFVFKSNEETLKRYPFHFEFYTTYRLDEYELISSYKVLNLSNKEMLFSFGAHPAFAMDKTGGLTTEDFYLEFNEVETAKTYVLDGPNIADDMEDYIDNSNIISLTDDTFINDAIMLKGLKSNKVTLKNRKNDNSVTVDYTGFPYIAFWNVPGADFVCIEPWYGIADFANCSGKLEEKVGIEKLADKEIFEAKLVFTINK